MAEATESPMRKRRTFIPISSVLDVDASLNAFHGFSMPYGASLTIMVNIIQRNGMERYRIMFSSQFFQNLYMTAVHGVVTEIGDK